MFRCRFVTCGSVYLNPTGLGSTLVFGSTRQNGLATVQGAVTGTGTLILLAGQSSGGAVFLKFLGSIVDSVAITFDRSSRSALLALPILWRGQLNVSLQDSLTLVGNAVPGQLIVAPTGTASF